MMDLDARNREWELSLESDELNEFHDSCNLRDDVDRDAEWYEEFVNGPGAGVDSDDEVAYLFGRMENAEIVNSAYSPQLDNEDF